MRKTPWRILAGAFAIALFYLTLGTVVGFLIYSAIQGQTHSEATLFDEWWLVLLFVTDVISCIGFVGSVVMDVWTRIIGKKTAVQAEVENEVV